MPNKLLSTITALLVAFVLVSVADACPNCKGSIEGEGRSMAIGFAWSIALMLAVPFSILSAWAIAIRRYIKQAS